MLVPVRASPVPSVVRGSSVVKFFSPLVLGAFGVLFLVYVFLVFPRVLVSEYSTGVCRRGFVRIKNSHSLTLVRDCVGWKK